MKSRMIGGRRRHASVDPARFLITPYALSGSPREVLVAGLCVAGLGLIFVAEILTPDVVVGAFALLPRLAAMWLLPGRLAALVPLIAVLFFGVVSPIGARTGSPGFL